MSAFYSGMQKVALGRGAIAAIAASAGIMGGGTIGAQKTHSDLMMSPSYRKLRGNDRNKVRNAQMTNGFIEGALKGGGGVAFITDLVVRKVI